MKKRAKKFINVAMAGITVTALSAASAVFTREAQEVLFSQGFQDEKMASQGVLPLLKSQEDHNKVLRILSEKEHV